MTTSLPANGPVQVTVTPTQSSFFAGEQIQCLITFTNLNQPIPQSQPLPSVSHFASHWSDNDPSRRTASHTPGPSSSNSAHARSQTVDLRTKPWNGSHHNNNSSSSSSTSDLRPGKQLLEYDREGNALPSRKGLIGSGTSGGNASIPSLNPSSVKNAGGHTKSASLAAFSSPSSPSSKNQPANAVGLGRPTSSPFASSQRQNVRLGQPSTSVLATSPAATRSASRKASSTIGSAHPHSRKKSVIQVQNEDLSASFEFGPPSRSQSPSRDGHRTLYAQDANASDTSLAGASSIDSPSIRQGADNPSAANSFYAMGHNETMDSVTRDQFSRLNHAGHRPSIPRLSISSASSGAALGNGETSGTNSSASPFFPQRPGLAPGTELVYWSFAQFAGSFEIDESLIKPGEFEEVKRKLAYGDGLTGPSAVGTSRTVGGGDFGQLDPDGFESTAAATGWTGYLRRVLSGSGDPSLKASSGATSPSRHRRTASTMFDSSQKTMSSKSIPLFSTPPSIVAVDLQLLPGESKTFSFSLQLPADLPPSYFGKAVRFTYELVVGTNRLDSKRGSGGQRSRLIKVPLRLYNHVNVTGAKPFFDLCNPVILMKDEATIREEEDADAQELAKSNQGFDLGAKSPTTPRSPSSIAPDYTSAKRKQREAELGKRALDAYARSLLASCQGADEEVSEDAKGLSTMSMGMSKSDSVDEFFSRSQRRNSGIPGLSVTAEDDAAQTCKGATELLSRNSQKVSYDIAKDGSIAAVLTLIKSKYRLGDTILGLVNINRPQAVAKVVRVAAVLESYEEIEPSLSTLPASRVQKLTRKVHAEHHEATLDSGQSCFSLPIPSGATPDFLTSGVKLHWTVRLSFLTAISSAKRVRDGNVVTIEPLAHLEPADEDGYAFYHTSHRALPSLAGPHHDLDDGSDGEKEEDGEKGLSGAGANEDGNAGSVTSGAVTDADVGMQQSPNQPQRRVKGAETRLEIVECAVPVTVLPNSTRFKAKAVSFAA